MKTQYTFFSKNCGSECDLKELNKIQPLFSSPWGQIQWKRLYQLAQVAIMKYHRWGGLNNRDLFSHHSRSWVFQIKLLVAGLVFLLPLFGLQIAAFSLCSHVVFPLCVHILGFFLCDISSSHKSYWNRFHPNDFILIESPFQKPPSVNRITL